MRPPLRDRLRAPRDDTGAFAILYAVLVIVLLGMSAVAVDFASVRQDRRLTRSATDSAVIGAAGFLNPGAAGGSSPYAACQAAWDYLTNTLQLASNPGRLGGANACTPFLPANLTGGTPTAYCAQATPTEIDAPWTIGNRTFQIAWPIPKGSGYLSPDLAPGTVAQTFNSVQDGSDAGCDRIGVAIFENATLALGSVYGVTGTSTQVHSVARYSLDTGPTPAVAALNVLDQHACKALDTGGQGDVLVNRGIDSQDATKFGPGIIAIESDGRDCGNAASDWVLGVSNSVNNRVCASGATQVPDLAGTCDGKGVIVQDALDPGGQRAYAGSPSTPTVPISPTPSPEGGISQWQPVTDIYGCHGLPTLATPAVDCSTLSPNYADTLYNDYAPGNAAPVAGSEYTGVGTYTGSVYGTFKTLPGPALPAFTCSPDNLYIPPGNWFINCPDGAQAGFSLQKNGSVVVFGGGHVIFQGGIDAAKNSGCFAFNVPITPAPAPGSVTCPGILNAQSSTATTVPAPTQEGILFSRGTKAISNGSGSVAMLLPQTMVVQSGGGALALGGGSGTVLWSAPGGGDRSTGSSRLSTLCAGASPCLNSHFEKIAYWNETTATDSIGGQGSVTYVGVYFAPRAAFTFAGQGGGAGTNAQFWADTLSLSGQAKLHLTPDAALAVPRNLFRVNLIR